MRQQISIFLTATCLQWSLASGTSLSADTEPPVCPCQYRYNPVCGSDNVTYVNECVLTCINRLDPNEGYSSVEKVHSGECKSLICQKLDLPVCTLDGITYPNECELAVENINRISRNESILYLAYRAECNGPPCNNNTIAAPVCGSDDILYRNEFVLKCASANNVNRGLAAITVKNNGACLDGCLCPFTKEPVCGSDRRKYKNVCELDCVNKHLSCSSHELVKIAHESVCEGCPCTAHYDPVCGSDGKSYPNECLLNCTAKRENKPNLVAVRKGTCLVCDCSIKNIPVCGTDHVTYRNVCHLRCANSRTTKYIGLYHYGSCLPDSSCDCSFCPSDYRPVCGSDRYSYWNSCWLLCYAGCLRTQTRLKVIRRISDEACYI